MTRRPIRPKLIEKVVMDHIKERGINWATAKELAIEIGYPWRAVARTLVYMARRNDIEQDYIEWRSSKFRMRRCAIYRYVVIPVSEYPAWLMPSGKLLRQSLLSN